MTPVPHSVRLLGRLVLEVLPAALASIIGGLLFAHYQFTHPPSAQAAAGQGPASPEMVQLVRDEHALLRQFMAAQEDAQRRQIAADAVDARGKGAAKFAAAKPTPPHHKTGAATAPLGVTAVPAPGPDPVVIARVQQISEPAPVVAPAPGAAPQHDEPALIAETLAVKKQMVGAALHAVEAIGGLPFWLEHRVGGDDLTSQASSAGTPL